MAKECTKLMRVITDLRVAIVYPECFGDDGIVGGGERYALELARELSKRMTTRLVLFGKNRQRDMLDRLCVDVYPWLTLVRGKRSNALGVSFLRGLAGVDVVHC